MINLIRPRKNIFNGKAIRAENFVAIKVNESLRTLEKFTVNESSPPPHVLKCVARVAVLMHNTNKKQYSVY